MAETATEQPLALLRCETCRGTVRAGQYPQCLDCLWNRVPPAEVVPLVAFSHEGIREKRAKWLMNHPGWELVPTAEYEKLAAPTQQTPMGIRMRVAEYAVRRGRSMVV